MIRPRTWATPWLAAILFAAWADSASALMVRQAAGVTTNMGTNSTTAPGTNINNTISQVQLSPIGYVSGVTDLDTFLAANPVDFSSSASNFWVSADGTTTGNVDFDLGAVRAVGAFVLWNFHSAGTHAVRDFTLIGATDAAFSNASTILTVTSAAQVGTSPNIGFTRYNFSIGAYSHIRLMITANYGQTFTGFAEAAFGDVVGAPEPSTTVLGLGIVAATWVGFRVRRRKAS